MPKKENSKEIKREIIPLRDRVLVKEVKSEKEKKTESGIIIPVTVSDDKTNKIATVINVGSGNVGSDGKDIPIKVKKGDKVVFQWGDKIIIDEEEYYIVKESEILAIIN